MKKIIKKILKEDREEQFLNKVILLLKDDYPLFKNLKDYGFNLSEDELNYVFSEIFGEPVKYSYGSSLDVYDDRGNKIYWEDSDGYWVKYEYSKNGNILYWEDSEGYWEKYEYDENRNLINMVNSYGHWYKKEYDENGNGIYYETSDGYWIKSEYDENGKLTYEEDPNGVIIDKR